MARKRKKNSEEPSPDIGVVMTVSLFLILLTFFIMLNSIAVLDDRRVVQSIGSILSAFGSFTVGHDSLKSGEQAAPPKPFMDIESIDLAKIMGVSKDTIKGMVTIKSLKDRETITFNHQFLFEKDKLKLKPACFSALNKLCDFINKGDYPVEIIGHTDNRPAQAKGYTSNWKLSALMAQTVFQYVKTRGKVSDKRLSAHGSGRHSPITSNETPGERAQNKRVDILLKYGASDYIKKIYKDKPFSIFTYLKFDFKAFE